MDTLDEQVYVPTPADVMRNRRRRLAIDHLYSLPEEEQATERLLMAIFGI